MKCERCGKNEATFYYKSSINGKVTEDVYKRQVYCVCAVLTSGFQGEGPKGYFGFVKKQCRVPFFEMCIRDRDRV